MTKVKKLKLITFWETMLVITLKAKILFQIFNLKNCTTSKYIWIWIRNFSKVRTGTGMNKKFRFYNPAYNNGYAYFG
jgi:hypothetical protein